MTLALTEIKDLALLAAIEAGTLIKEIRDAGIIEHRYKDQQELVTSADIAADKLITERIKAQFPTHRILSEEGYNDKSVATDLESPIWIIDPIDGTVNYAHGHVMVAVSIAFACNGEVQVGVVHNPFMNETFTAIKGLPSTLNEQPIRASGLGELRKALVATGFPYNKSDVPPIVNRVEKTLMACQDIRRLGSAALDICWVACGRLDAYFESLSPWDFAAARLIALEAGARCGHFTSVPTHIPECIHCNDLLISSPALYEELKAILKNANH